MRHTFPFKGFGLFVITSLCLAGCAEVTYQRLNDPSRDTWQKP